MKKDKAWSNVRVTKGLLIQIDRAIKESSGSYTSRADFVKAAIREKLEKKEDILLARDVVAAIKKHPELRKVLKKTSKD